MADEQEEVDGAWRVGDDGLEPGLVDHGGGGDYFGYVGVAREVEEDAKGQDADAVLGGEVLVLVAEVFIFIGGGVEDLNVGGEISVAPDLGELVVVLIRNVGVVELMVACMTSKSFWGFAIHGNRGLLYYSFYTYQLSRGRSPASGR